MSTTSLVLITFLMVIALTLVIVVPIVVITHKNYNKARFFYIDDKMIEIKTSIYNGSYLLVDGKVVDEQPRAYGNVYGSVTLSYAIIGFNLRVNIGTSYMGLKPTINVFLNNEKLPLLEFKGEKISSDKYVDNVNNDFLDGILNTDLNDGRKDFSHEKSVDFKYCSNCGAKITKVSKYCNNCGAKQDY